LKAKGFVPDGECGVSEDAPFAGVLGDFGYHATSNQTTILGQASCTFWPGAVISMESSAVAEAKPANSHLCEICGFILLALFM
jgi:hypothetical protein